LDPQKSEAMIASIMACREQQDSIGGILDTAVIGLEAGIGEPEFDSIESQLSHAMFSIPAVKGIEFGEGFHFADMYGSQANDAFAIDHGKIITKTNHNGGINGGISNGMPIRFRTAVKPTPSIAQMQDTVDFAAMKEKKLTIAGRHDPAVIHRARVVVDAMTAFVLTDLLLERHGTLYFGDER
jgi:chorismate synthase